MSKQMTQQEPKKMTKVDVAKQIPNWRSRDAELVTGIFKNLETRGGSVTFNYKAYPGDDFRTYHLMDGERYSIPRGVARHLNNNCFYKEYKHLKGEFGDTGVRGAFNDGRLKAENMQMAQKVHRYAFHSMEFMDDDIDMKQSDLVEVTVSP